MARPAEFVIRPDQGCGPIAFGASRTAVMGTLGMPNMVSDDWESEHELVYAGVKVFLDSDGTVKAVGVHPGRGVVPVIDGIPLFGRFKDVAKQLERAGHALCGHPCR